MKKSTLIATAVALVALIAMAFGLSATAAADEAQEAQERANYIRAVEPICAEDARRNARILKGVRRQVSQGELAIASRRFARATRAFTGTLRSVLQVPRPATDRRQLNSWIRLLFKQRSYLAQITRSLGQGNRFESQRLSVLLVRNAHQANAAVAGFGFRQCVIRPNQFM